MQRYGKLWKTIVRVDDFDEEEGIFYVIIPGWDAYKAVKLYFDSVPKIIKERIIKKGEERFFVKVNTGAESSEDLFFIDWE